MGCGASKQVAPAFPAGKQIESIKPSSGAKPSDENRAASVIGSRAKGRSERKHLEQQHKNATKVQAVFRGNRDRRLSAQRRDEFNIQREVKTSGEAQIKRSQSGGKLQRVNDYAFVKMLGKGAYGQVYLAEYDPETSAAPGAADKPMSGVGLATGLLNSAVGTVSKAMGDVGELIGLSEKPPEVAIKVLSRSILKRKRVGRTGSAYDSVLGEIAIMKHLRHPNIVRLYEVIDDPDEDLLFMCMELVTGRDLSEPITQKRVIPEQELRVWLRGITLGLEHLHLSGVCHRDIKPENLLWDPVTKTVKLTDFGISGFFRATALGGDFFNATAGSLAFFAPEMCRSIKGAGYSGRAADLWACGVSLYMWLYHDSPFMADNPPALLKAIAEDTIVYPVREPAPSAELMSLLVQLLEKQAPMRIRIKSVRRDPFITNSGAEPLDDPLPVVNARDGAVAVPKSELSSAIERIRSINRSSLIAQQYGDMKPEEYEMVAKQAERECVAEEEQQMMASLVETKESSDTLAEGGQGEGGAEGEGRSEGAGCGDGDDGAGAEATVDGGDGAGTDPAVDGGDGDAGGGEA